MGARVDFVLGPRDREVLERWARRPKTSQALALRSRIVLAAAEGRASTEIASELGVTASTVGRWRGRFARMGLDGLHDEPRPGQPRKISDDDVERVIVKTLEEQPANATHWSTRSMAAAAGLNGTYVSVPYGGAAFAGRFQWTVMPVLMAWAPLALRRVDRSAVRIGVVGGTIAVLWLVQLGPILADRHVYFTADYPTPPWDPASYPGWWSGFNVLLPVFTSPRRTFGNPWFAVVVELAVVLGAGLVIVRLCRRRPISPRPFAAAMGVAAVALILLAVAAPRPLPTRPLSFVGSDLGASLVTSGGSGTGPTVPLQGIGSGRYQARLDYTLAGTSASGTLLVYCTLGTLRSTSSPRAGVSVSLVRGSHTTAGSLRCPAGTLWARLAVGANSGLAVRTLQITKTST